MAHQLAYCHQMVWDDNVAVLGDAAWEYFAAKSQQMTCAMLDLGAKVKDFHWTVTQCPWAPATDLMVVAEIT